MRPLAHDGFYLGATVNVSNELILKGHRTTIREHREHPSPSVEARTNVQGIDWPSARQLGIRTDSLRTRTNREEAIAVGVAAPCLEQVAHFAQQGPAWLGTPVNEPIRLFMTSQQEAMTDATWRAIVASGDAQKLEEAGKPSVWPPTTSSPGGCSKATILRWWSGFFPTE